MVLSGPAHSLAKSNLPRATRLPRRSGSSLRERSGSNCTSGRDGQSAGVAARFAGKRLPLSVPASSAPAARSRPHLVERKTHLALEPVLDRCTERRYENGSAAIHASFGAATCLPPATTAASMRSRRVAVIPFVSNTVIGTMLNVHGAAG